MTRSMHFSQICVSDLILVDEEGQIVIGDQPINGTKPMGKTLPCHRHSLTLLPFCLQRLLLPSTVRSTRLDQTCTPPAMPTQFTAKLSLRLDASST